VDDDPATRQLTEFILTSHGYHVAVAMQGQEGIQRLCETCPDLILLDLKMPVLDGWQFCAKQRCLTDQRLASVPVVLMTGADDAARHADTLGAVGVINKPFDPGDMLNAVAAGVGSRTSVHVRRRRRGLKRQR
jgi:CheY-like chemotaxis protein